MAHRARCARQLAIGMILGLILAGCSPIPLANRSQLVVGVIDTAIDSTALGLLPYMTGEVVMNSADPHGTRMASIIAGLSKSSRAALPASRVRLRSYAVTSTPSSDEIAKALDAALNDDVTVVSISLGTRRSSPRLEKSVARAEQLGIPVIAAAGNARFLQADFPARLSSAIAIGAVDESGDLLRLSSHRPLNGVALGVDRVHNEAGDWETISGTSVAAARTTNALLQRLIAGTITSPTQFKPDQPDVGVDFRQGRNGA